MKIPMSSILVFAATLAAANGAKAETYQHGGSTATIDQHSDNGHSETQLRQYDDGQRIISRDGNSTDVTIQREESSFSAPYSPADEDWQYADDSDDDDFYRPLIERRFSHFTPDNSNDSDEKGEVQRRMDDVKHRLFERMSGDFSER